MKIPGFDNYEFIEGEGIYSLNYKRTGIKKLLSPGRNQDGYLRVSMVQKKKLHTVTVHRIAALCYFGPCPKGLEVNHKNGDKTDYSRLNLEYISGKENVRHYYKNNIVDKSGEKNGRAKLTKADIYNIKKRRSSGEWLKYIAIDYRVTPSLISQIARGIIWAE